MSLRELYFNTRSNARAGERGQSFVLAMLCLATVAVFSNMYTTQPVLPVIGQEFGLQPSEAGLTVSALVLAIACSAVFYGFLSDRFGRHRVIIGCALALALPTLLCAFSPSFLFLVLCRIGQGLIIPGFIASTVSYLHEEFPQRRGSALGWYTAATVIGGFTGRLQGGLMTDFFNWRLAFASFALLNLLAGYLLLRYLPPSQYSHPRGEKAGLELSGFLACLKDPRLLGAYLLGPAIFFPFIGLFTYLPYYLTRPPFNLSGLLVSFIFVVYLVGTFAAPLCGRLSDRFGRRVIMGSGVILMAAGSALTLVPWLPVLFGGLLILCFGMFAVQSTTNAYLGDSVRKGQGRGSAVSLYQMFFYFGGSFGGLFCGLLWQTGGWLPLIAGCLLALGTGLFSVISLCR